ncbi:MAG: acetaldehyde dehydrogenase (acetylating) [Flavobacteriales bacterium]|jgi:acetaldehyde dehydrogenase (acetylating)
MEYTASLNVAIIGSGKLGTDLLIKTLRSPYLNCVLFVGRNHDSEGLVRARSLGVPTSDDSIDAIINYKGVIHLVFDVTSAEYHIRHADVFERLGIKAIDLTPAKVGPLCVPSINQDIIFTEDNINLITCGGQASLPIVHRLSEIITDISKIEVNSFLAEDSVGPGTLANIDEYYSTTKSAIREYTGVQDVEVQLNLESSEWKPDMLTYIRAYTGKTDLRSVYEPLRLRLLEVQKHVPGYQIVGTPKIENGIIDITVSVRGNGDWLPAHAGNLDIINCAALALAEHYAEGMGVHSWEEKKQHSGGSLPVGDFMSTLTGANKLLERA